MISALDADYHLQDPVLLHAQGLDEIVVREAAPGCAARRPARSGTSVVDALEHPTGEVDDRHGRQVRRSHRVLQVADRGADPRRHPDAHPGQCHLSSTRKTSRSRWPRPAAGLDAILVPGGFGKRGIEGKIAAVTLRARERGFLTWASASACSWPSSNSPATWPAWKAPIAPKFARHTPHPVIALITEWQNARRPDREARSRIPTWAAPCAWARSSCQLAAGSLAAQVYGATSITERHRHRYEVNNHYLTRLRRGGPAAFRQDARRATGRDGRDAPTTRGFRPASSTPSSPPLRAGGHPLFTGFVRAARATPGLNQRPWHSHETLRLRSRAGPAVFPDRRPLRRSKASNLRSIPPAQLKEI